MIQIDPPKVLSDNSFCTSGGLNRRTIRQSLALEFREARLASRFVQRRKRTVVKKRLLRPVEVEAEYGLPSGELAKKRVAGGGDAPPFLRFGRAIYYDRDDLERWIASSKRNSTSDPGPGRHSSS